LRAVLFGRLRGCLPDVFFVRVLFFLTDPPLACLADPPLDCLVARVLDCLGAPPATRELGVRLADPVVEGFVVVLVDRLFVEVEGQAAEGLLELRGVLDVGVRVPALRDGVEVLAVPGVLVVVSVLAVPEGAEA
jgi:hypothetical protein